MAKKKKIKLKGSSIFDKNKPLNKKRKLTNRTVNTNSSLSKKRPLNKIVKTKKAIKKNNLRPYSNISKTPSTRYLPDIIEKRYLLISIVIVLAFVIIGSRLFQLQVLKTEEYNEKLVSATVKYVEGDSAPRGRIYDRNYKLLVDNEAIKTIYYKKQDGITTKEEIELAYTLGEMLEIDYAKLSTNMLKTFWYKHNKEKAEGKITKKERKQYNERKLTADDLEDLIYERITLEELAIYTEQDKEAAYIYYLMNKGYSYAEKIIKNKDVTDEEYAIISENIDTLKGVNTKLDWERTYLYGDTFKSILGTVSSSNQGIPSELVDYYLDNGYSLNDRVGISFIEKQYESILKGSKNKYIVNSNGSYSLYEEGTRGNDIVLTIDINLQREVEKILKEQVVQGMKELPFGFYNRSFVIIQEPSTGEVLAMSGIQAVYKNGSYSTYDVTDMILTNPVTVGSAIKGASHIVGYNNNALKNQ